MIKKNIFILGLCFLLMGCGHSSREQRLLSECTSTDVSYDNNRIQFLNKKTGRYLIHNESKNTIFLDIPPEQHRGASAGWGAKLEAGRWAAVQLSREPFAFVCLSGSKNTQPVPCSMMLMGCQLSSQGVEQMPTQSIVGGHWVVVNVDFSQLLKP